MEIFPNKFIVCQYWRLYSYSLQEKNEFVLVMAKSYLDVKYKAKSKWLNGKKKRWLIF